MSNKILFLNLDGTCRRAKSGATFINDSYDQELIPGVEEAIAPGNEYMMVGDRSEDQECTANANVPFMWAEEWRNGR